MSMGTIEQAFKAIDSLRDESRRTVERVIQSETRISVIEKQHIDASAALQATEKRMTQAIDYRHLENQRQLTKILGDLEELMAEYNRSRGRNQVAAWVPTIISCIIGLAAILTII